mgnify:CR=1 FL=1
MLVLSSDHCKLCSVSIDDVLLVSFDHVSYVLLTDVHLADKIMKAEWDRAGGGRRSSLAQRGRRTSSPPTGG